MPNYRRPRPRAATVFFTVCLAERGSDLLLRRIDLLREAVRVTRAHRPFGIDAWVVLPDHIHAVWTLPEADPSYGQRWGAIKARFSKHVRLAGDAPEVPAFGRRGGVNPALRKSEVGIWQHRFWEQATCLARMAYLDRVFVVIVYIWIWLWCSLIIKVLTTRLCSAQSRNG